MEAVIAEPPVDCYPRRYVPQVSFVPGRLVVAIHAVAWKAPFESSGDEFDLPYAQELLRNLSIHLLRIVDEALNRGARGSVCDAVDSAFKRMNEIQESTVGPKHAKEAFWRVQHTSMLVIVRGDHVHIFGQAFATAFLCRGNRDEHLAPQVQKPLATQVQKPPNSVTKFGYYHKVKLTEEDSHLVVGAAHINSHVVGDFTPVLLTRINAVGLEEACKQIAGRFEDHPRTFVCVPITDVHRVSGAEPAPEPEPESDWGVIGPGERCKRPRGLSLKKLAKLCERDKDPEEACIIHSDRVATRHTHLFPLRNGKPQEPTPLTFCYPSVPRGPCIRKLELEEWRWLLTCKYKRCSILIGLGYDPLDQDSGSTQVVPLINLETFMDDIKHAISLGIRNLVVKVVRGRAATGDNSLFQGAREVVRWTIEFVGTADFGKKEVENKDEIKVHFCVPDPQIWHAFVAGTDLLAHWDWDEMEQSLEHFSF